MLCDTILIPDDDRSLGTKLDKFMIIHSSIAMGESCNIRRLIYALSWSSPIHLHGKVLGGHTCMPPVPGASTIYAIHDRQRVWVSLVV